MAGFLESSAALESSTAQVHTFDYGEIPVNELLFSVEKMKPETEKLETERLLNNGDFELSRDGESDTGNDDSVTKQEKVLIVGVVAGFAQTFAQVGGIASVQRMIHLPPDFELNALIFAVGTIFSIVYLLWKRTLPRVATPNIKWLMIIALITIVYNLSLYSHFLKRIPIVTLLCIHQTYRIILTLVVTTVCMKVEIPLKKYVICVLTLSGAILTIIPRVEVYLEYPETSVRSENYSNHQYVSDSTGIQNGTSNVDILNVTEQNGSSQVQGQDEKGYLDFGEHDVRAFLIAVCVILGASFCGTMEQVIISASPLKNEGTLIFTFWYFFIGTVVSTIAMFLFEHPFIPDNTLDIVLCCGHSISASAATFLFILAIQNLDLNSYVIIATFRLPLALICQATILKEIIPVKHLHLLVIGMVIVGLTTISMPIFEFYQLRKMRKMNEEENCDK